MSAVADDILVGRLQRVYWPAWCRRITLAKVMRAAPEGYRERNRDAKYDLGRVRYFMQRFKRGETVDPIIIDVEVHQYSYNCPPIWGLPFIDDGHHRFIAAVLLRRRRIDASCRGLVEDAKWLSGIRRRLVMPDRL